MIQYQENTLLYNQVVNTIYQWKHKYMNNYRAISNLPLKP